MTSLSAPKDKFFERVINPYLVEVLHHPQTIEMREGVLHIRDVEGPRRTGSMKTRLEAMDQQVFKCHGMVERGVNANQMMIAEFTNNHKLDAKNIGETIFKLHEKIEHVQAQIYDLQNQNYEYDYRLKRMSLVEDLRILETRSSFYDGEPMPWKMDDKPTTSKLHHHHLRRKRHKYMGMGTPLGNCQAWGRCPDIVSPSHLYLYCFS